MPIEKLKIIHDKENCCFYYKSDSFKGEINYEIKDNKVLNIYRTFVNPELRGKGIARVLLMKVINYVQAEGYRILPSCSFAVSFFRHNKKYQNLLVLDVNLDNPGSCRLSNNQKN